MAKKKRSKRDEKVMEWIKSEGEQTTGELLNVLTNELHGKYKELPGEIVTAIHNMALYNLLKVVNLPRHAMPKTGDLDAYMRDYDDYAKAASHNLSAFCQALTEWRPEMSQN